MTKLLFLAVVAMAQDPKPETQTDTGNRVEQLTEQIDEQADKVDQLIAVLEKVAEQKQAPMVGPKMPDPPPQAPVVAPKDPEATADASEEAERAVDDLEAIETTLEDSGLLLDEEDPEPAPGPLEVTPTH